MSSDTSPPSGYRLDNPARTAGATSASGGNAPVRQISGGARRMGQSAAAPSWIKVIGTTLRLWVRRRVLRVPDTGRVGRARRAGFAAVIVVAVAAVAVTAVVELTGSPASQRTRQHAATTPRLTPAQKRARAAAAAQAAANGTAAVDWIAAEVSQQAVIGCDPATCAAILTAGYAGGGKIVLQPGALLPAVGALVVATPAVRAQYGAQLATTAPAVIASFGSGAEAVQVRVVVAGGQAAYSQAASSAIAARRNAGIKLIGNGRVRVRAAAREDLAGGLVDPRLLTVLQRLATRYPVTISRFGDAGPNADTSTPFRLAEIIGLTTQHRRGQTSELAGAEKLLEHQPSGYRAALTVVRLAGGKYGLKIQFAAPSPQ
ncbi:MAG TPA: hypothetical protein VGH96_14230 [Streptosporangiaceae bacterium]